MRVMRKIEGPGMQWDEDVQLAGIAIGFSMLLTQIRQESHQVMSTYLLIRCLGAAAIALVLALGMTVLAPFLIEIVFGAEFSQAADLLRIMVWLLVPSFVLAIVFETSVATNKESAYRTAAAVIVVMTLVSLTVIIQSGNHMRIADLKVALEVVFSVLALSFLLHRIRRIN